MTMLGDWLTVGATAELEIGTVVLHVDDSSNNGIAVVLIGSTGSGYLHWMQIVDGKWAGSLAGISRKLLAMPAEQRVIEAAKHVLTSLREEADTPAEKLAYYENLAGAANLPQEQNQ